MRPLLLIALSVCAACVSVTGSVWAATPSRLWATVNVCDTKASPNVIGVRASMPGDGKRDTRMFMRFGVEFRDGATNEWKPVRKGGDSGWVAVGAGRYVRRESGRSFEFDPSGGAIRLRGRVSFEWRRGGKVVKRAVRVTEAGHRSAAGADPADFSAAECVIEP